MTVIASDGRSKAKQTIQLAFKVNESRVFQKNFFNFTRSAALDVIPLAFKIVQQDVRCEFWVENQTVKYDYDMLKDQLTIRVGNHLKTTGFIQIKLSARCGALVRDSALIFINMINKVNIESIASIEFNWEILICSSNSIIYI